MECEFSNPISSMRNLRALARLLGLGFNITKFTLNHTSLTTQQATGRKAS